MSTAAQIKANQENSQSSSGPRTEEGKSSSSRNAVRQGLFTVGDFVRPEEEDDYEILCAELKEELAPVGLIENNLTAEIRRAMWRLGRCAEVEAELVGMLGNSSEPIPDAMQNEATARLQNSVDRARTQTHRLLHKCTTELRRLQTERLFREEALSTEEIERYGLGDQRAFMKAMDEQTVTTIRMRKLKGLDTMMGIVRSATPPVEPPVTNQSQSIRPESAPVRPEITKRTQSAVPASVAIARNAPCPCNSGKKYKRCCGENAPAILSGGLSAAA
jgi:hypothetical protein